jgi:hypothetical protein
MTALKPFTYSLARRRATLTPSSVQVDCSTRGRGNPYRHAACPAERVFLKQLLTWDHQCKFTKSTNTETAKASARDDHRPSSSDGGNVFTARATESEQKTSS